MAWIFLAIAIVLEVIATFLLKLSNGLEKLHWAALSVVFYTMCFGFLAPAMKMLPIGMVYAIWSGIGIVAITLIGFFAFEERLSAIQYWYIALILVGAVGLKLTTLPNTAA